jgi:uncharacterized damage-inducible protein DinB
VENGLFRYGTIAFGNYAAHVDRPEVARLQTDEAPVRDLLARMTREEMLMHVITHGVGHRGQVSAVMLFSSVTPPSDGFTTYLHKAEGSMRRRAMA